LLSSLLAAIKPAGPAPTMQTGLGFAGGVEECDVVIDGQDLVIEYGGFDTGHPPAGHDAVAGHVSVAGHDSLGWFGSADAPSQRTANESKIFRIVKTAWGYYGQCRVKDREIEMQKKVAKKITCLYTALLQAAGVNDGKQRDRNQDRLKFDPIIPALRPPS
jgi:hypothetical protein